MEVDQEYCEPSQVLQDWFLPHGLIQSSFYFSPHIISYSFWAEESNGGIANIVVRCYHP